MVISTILLIAQPFLFNLANIGTQLTPLQQTIQSQKVFRQGLRLLRTKAENTINVKHSNGTNMLPSVTSDIILPAIKAVIDVGTPTPTPPTTTVTTPSSTSTTEESILFLGNRTEFETKFPLLDWISYARWHSAAGTVSKNRTVLPDVKAQIPLQYRSLEPYILHRLLHNQTIFKTGPINKTQSIFHYITKPRNHTHSITKRFVPASVLSGAMKIGTQAVKSGFIKDFVFQMAKPILSRVVANDQSKLLGNWAANLLPNTHISNSHVQTNIRELIKNEDSQGVVRALEKSRLSYNVDALYEEQDPKRINVIDTAIRENLPFYDEVLRERLSSSALVTNTLITSWFQTLKSTLTEDIQGAAQKMDLFQKVLDKLTKLAVQALDHVNDYITYALLVLANLLLIGIGISSYVANRQTQKGIGFLGMKLAQMERKTEQYIQDRMAENRPRITEIKNPREQNTRISVRSTRAVTPL